MQAGKLRERVTIQRETVTRDSFGAEVNPWKDVTTVWASVRPGASGERFISAADQMQATITHTVRIRQRAGISPKMRLLWGTRKLDIQSVVDPDGRRREVLLLCEEIVETPAPP